MIVDRLITEQDLTRLGKVVKGIRESAVPEYYPNMGIYLIELLARHGFYLEMVEAP